MSVIDHLTDDDVIHLDDPAWREIVARLGHIDGWFIMELLARVDFTKPPMATCGREELMRGLDRIVVMHMDAEYTRELEEEAAKEAAATAHD